MGSSFDMFEGMDKMCSLFFGNSEEEGEAT